MKVVMNMVRTPYKQGDVIFDISEKSDDLYLIHTGTVQIESSEGLALATLEQGEMFGEMASILGERERTARAVAVNNVLVWMSLIRRQCNASCPIRIRCCERWCAT